MEIKQHREPWPDHPTMKYREMSMLYGRNVEDYFEAAESLITWLDEIK